MDNQILISPQNERSDYERVVNSIATSMGMSAAQFKAAFKVSPQTLKLGAILSNTNGIYEFSPVSGSGVSRPMPQVQMNKNDFFAVSNLGLGFAKCDFVSATNTYQNFGNYPIFSYPDPGFFAGAPVGAATESACLNTIVNGLISLSVASDPVLLPTLARDFVYNPEGTYIASPITHPRLGGDKVNRGYSELTPSFIIDGNSDVSFSLVLSDGAKTDLDGSISPGTTAATTRNVLWLFVNGWVVKNLSDGGRSCDLKKV